MVIRRHATHRSIVVVDIVESTSPIRRTGDKVIIRGAMYNALFGSFSAVSAWMRVPVPSLTRTERPLVLQRTR